eukprot:385762_1
MAEEQNKHGSSTQIRIKKLPQGMISTEDFELVPSIKLNELAENELLIETEYLSVDPYQRGRIRGWFNNSPTRQMQSYTVAKVLKSSDPNYKAGDYVYGVWAWSDKNIVSSKSVFRKIATEPTEEKDKFDASKVPRSYYVGSYGMPGITAYYGMLIKGGLKKGQNVLISGAAGAVGSICGQIAKLYG